MKRRQETVRGSFFVLLGIVLYLTGCNGEKNEPGSSPGNGTSVTITGTIQYEDRPYDSGGFTGTVLHPVRKAIVEVVRDADSRVLTSGATALDGSYSLAFTNTGQAGVYVRVRAQTADSTVTVSNSSGVLYAIITLGIDDSMAPGFSGVDLTATTADIGGVFNILDVLLTGAEFVTTLAGVPPPLVTAEWAAGSCDGTYFDPADDSIHILGGGNTEDCPLSVGDTDEYDDPVLLHEYGHFIADNYSKDHSPGGIHYLDDNTQDIRLSWSEGWGNFFTSAVRNDPLYMDTSGTVAQLSFEIENLTPTGLSSAAIYTTNELSVAAALWDIFDAPSTVEGWDAVSAGMTPIWDVFANDLICTNCGITNVSFEDFWDGWFVRGYGLPAEMETVVADRQMALKADGFEPDDTAANAKPITVNAPIQTHTFYPSGDVDYVSFSATLGTIYTVRTSGLTNGADSFLEVLNTSGTTVLSVNDDATTVTKSSTCGVNPVTQQSNCPPNDATTLSSKVLFTAPADGTYYVRVSRS
ncbi:MAG: PPC domain-containing protein, partial [Nitrospirota bacterium]